MDAGRLNNRVEIQHKIQGIDSVGATVYDWVTLCCVWANIRHISGAEAIKADAVQSISKVSICIRSRTDIIFTSAMRVLYKKNIYEIKSVLPDNYDKAYLYLICEQVE